MPWDEEYKALEAEVERLREIAAHNAEAYHSRGERLKTAERERDEARDLLSQWYECWNDNLEADGDLLAATGTATSGEE